MNDKTNWIAHHGIKGQKWGVRKYQNTDGSLTSLGQKHRNLIDNKKDLKNKKKKAKKAAKVKNKELKKAFAYEARSSNKTLLGNIYDRITGADKIYAQAKMKTASSAEKQKAIKEYYKTHFKKKKG